MWKAKRFAILVTFIIAYFMLFKHCYNTHRLNTLISTHLKQNFDKTLFAESLQERIEITKKFLIEDFENDYADINPVTLDDDPCIDLRIVVIVFDRSRSLRRLLNSLNEADYMGDCVVLDVWIDRSTDHVIDDLTYKTAREFSFRYGTLRVHNQSKHVGIYGQWMNTWHPADDSHDIAVYLEDDLTVSPHFYRWLKAVHNMYDERPDINGYSLYSVSVRHKDTFRHKIVPNFIPPEHVVYLYPLLATWGFSPKKRNWEKFLLWFQKVSRDNHFQPIVPGLMATHWYRRLMAKNKTNTMWSMWHIYYAWKNSEFTLHPNLPARQSLAINWKEPGLHFSNKSVTEKDESEIRESLLELWDNEFIQLPKEPVRLSTTGAIVNSI